MNYSKNDGFMKTNDSFISWGDYWSHCCPVDGLMRLLTHCYLFFTFVHPLAKIFTLLVSVDLCRMERAQQTGALPQRGRNDAAFQQNFFLGHLSHLTDTKLKTTRRSAHSIHSHRQTTSRLFKLPRNAGDHQRAQTRCNWPANRYMGEDLKSRQETLRSPV